MTILDTDEALDQAALAAGSASQATINRSTLFLVFTLFPVVTLLGAFAASFWIGWASLRVGFACWACGSASIILGRLRNIRFPWPVTTASSLVAPAGILLIAVSPARVGGGLSLQQATASALTLTAAAVAFAALLRRCERGPASAGKATHDYRQAIKLLGPGNFLLRYCHVIDGPEPDPGHDPEPGSDVTDKQRALWAPNDKNLWGRIHFLDVLDGTRLSHGPGKGLYSRVALAVPDTITTCAEAATVGGYGPNAAGIELARRT